MRPVWNSPVILSFSRWTRMSGVRSVQLSSPIQTNHTYHLIFWQSKVKTKAWPEGKTHILILYLDIRARVGFCCSHEVKCIYYCFNIILLDWEDLQSHKGHSCHKKSKKQIISFHRISILAKMAYYEIIHVILGKFLWLEEYEFRS